MVGAGARGVERSTPGAESSQNVPSPVVSAAAKADRFDTALGRYLSNPAPATSLTSRLSADLVAQLQQADAPDSSSAATQAAAATNSGQPQFGPQLPPMVAPTLTELGAPDTNSTTAELENTQRKREQVKAENESSFKEEQRPKYGPDLIAQLDRLLQGGSPASLPAGPGYNDIYGNVGLVNDLRANLVAQSYALTLAASTERQSGTTRTTA